MPKNGIKLFRVLGIDVYLHWAWILVALFELQQRQADYASVAWNVAEYLSLFGIVLLHEFGHALACRSVGGVANRIMLWPLGGAAFVSPPQRPGAVLWSIAAGPLVNVALIPVTVGLVAAARNGHWGTPDLQHYLRALAFMNFLLLVFNLLPAYPLDGGQILRALLWFLVGPVTSLRVACLIGFVGAAGVVALAFVSQSVYLGFMGAFMGLQSWAGWQQAKAMAQARDAPAHAGVACPACGAPPPAGPFWRCPCGNKFDTFAHNAACPKCGRVFADTICPRCGKVSPRPLWHAQGWQPRSLPVPGFEPVGVRPPGHAPPPGQWGPVPPLMPPPPPPPAASAYAPYPLPPPPPDPPAG